MVWNDAFCPLHLLRVLRVGFDNDVEVLGSVRVAVKGATVCPPLPQTHLSDLFNHLTPPSMLWKPLEDLIIY